MDVLNLLVDFLVNIPTKLGESPNFSIVLFCFVLIKVLHMIFDYKLKKSVIQNTYDLSMNDKKIVRYLLRGSELLSDNGESDLPHPSIGKNLSNNDCLSQGDDELPDEKKIILFAKAASALKGEIMQNENKK